MFREAGSLLWLLLASTWVLVSPAVTVALPAARTRLGQGVIVGQAQVQHALNPKAPATLDRALMWGRPRCSMVDRLSSAAARYLPGSDVRCASTRCTAASLRLADRRRQVPGRKVDAFLAPRLLLDSRARS